VKGRNGRGGKGRGWEEKEERREMEGGKRKGGEIASWLWGMNAPGSMSIRVY